MKLVFAGLENPIELAAGECTTLEVANSTLFTRVVCSLMSGEGDRVGNVGVSACSDRL